MLLNVSTWSCLQIRMQDEVTITRKIIVPLKGWNFSNIWGKKTPNESKFFQEEIKGRMKSGNAYYDSVQNLLSSGILSKNIKIKI